MTTLFVTVALIAFFIILILNIFFVYIPIAKINNDVNYVTERFEILREKVEPVIDKIEPVLESLVGSLISDF